MIPIQNQNLVKETVRVLDDTLTRLKDAVGDLQDYVVSPISDSIT